MAEKEYIEREAAIESMCRLCSDTTRDKCNIANICNHVCRLEAIPAADVRPVVLCRDCVMYECHEYDGGLKYVCRLFKRQMQETDFCSYGEKREES